MFTGNKRKIKIDMLNGFSGLGCGWAFDDSYNNGYIETKVDENGMHRGGDIVKAILDIRGVPMCFVVTSKCIDKKTGEEIPYEDVISAPEVDLYEPWSYTSPMDLESGYSIFEIMDDDDLRRFIDGGYYFDQETGTIKTDDPNAEATFEF